MPLVRNAVALASRRVREMLPIQRTAASTDAHTARLAAARAAKTPPVVESKMTNKATAPRRLRVIEMVPIQRTAASADAHKARLVATRAAKNPPVAVPGTEKKKPAPRRAVQMPPMPRTDLSITVHANRILVARQLPPFPTVDPALHEDLVTPAIPAIDETTLAPEDAVAPVAPARRVAPAEPASTQRVDAACESLEDFARGTSADLDAAPASIASLHILPARAMGEPLGASARDAMVDRVDGPDDADADPAAVRAADTVLAPASRPSPQPPQPPQPPLLPQQPQLPAHSTIATVRNRLIDWAVEELASLRFTADQLVDQINAQAQRVHVPLFMELRDAWMQHSFIRRRAEQVVLASQYTSATHPRVLAAHGFLVESLERLDAHTQYHARRISQRICGVPFTPPSPSPAARGAWSFAQEVAMELLQIHWELHSAGATTMTTTTTTMLLAWLHEITDDVANVVDHTRDDARRLEYQALHHWCEQLRLEISTAFDPSWV